MKVLFDTTVLVASLVKAHPSHARCFDWHRRALRPRMKMLVAAHTLLELYAVLTRLPLRPRIEPSIAARLVRESVTSRCEVVALSASDYAGLVEGASSIGLSGGIVTDALVARAAEISGADVLLTLNPDHFRRAWPQGAGRVKAP
jgi:predicted nucleic acid-binding protein